MVGKLDLLGQWGRHIAVPLFKSKCDMKVTVIIEKAKDGYYSCYVEDDLPGFGLSGFGESAEAAKEDMMKTYQEMKEIQAEEGKEVPELEFTYKYDMQSFFDYFSFLNVSKVAELAGINPSLMRQYTSGVANAGQKQYDKIRVAIGKISKELSAATF
ncbi:MAG TPA: type II toxin-antitoxin system HicB family antitoxin [Candidatus Parabacteroides intestinavium]|nr:type II toxin-antitoxin system HicB family antitoxin [Candidatus Parabacteroides intestinavium]